MATGPLPSEAQSGSSKIFEIKKEVCPPADR